MMVLMKPILHNGDRGWKDPPTNCPCGIIWNVHKDGWRWAQERVLSACYLSLEGSPHPGLPDTLIFLEDAGPTEFYRCSCFQTFQTNKNTTSKQWCWPNKICLPFRCDPSQNLWPKCTFLLKNFEKHNWSLSCSWGNITHCILERLQYFF